MAGDILATGSTSSASAITINGKLSNTGRILIDGSHDGDITVRDETERNSLIRMTDGLGATGNITINNGAGNFNANGFILVGELMFQGQDVTFDGSILIKKDANGSGGGASFGPITVVGCHDPADQLDICICCEFCPGDPVVVTQGTCDPQISDPVWACLSGCP